MKVWELFEDVSEEENLISMLKSHCKDNLKAIAAGTVQPLYRGAIVPSATVYHPDANHSVEYTKIKGRTSLRSSRTDIDLFLDFVSSSPDWSKFPIRNLSTFASVSYSQAKGFNDGHEPWLIIPFDDCSIGTLNGVDFNYYKPDTKRMLFTFGNKILDIAKSLDRLVWNEIEQPELKKLVRTKEFSLVLSKRQLTIEQIKELSNAIKGLCDYYKGVKYEDATPDKYSKHEINLIQELIVFKQVFATDNLWVWLNDYINPSIMDAKPYSNYYKMGPTKPSSEIWFEGDYIMPSDDIHSGWFKKLAKDVTGYEMD